MTSSTLILQAVLAAVYFGAGWLVKHASSAPSGSPAGTVLAHMLAELEAQGAAAARALLSQALAPSSTEPAPAPKP